MSKVPSITTYCHLLIFDWETKVLRGILIAVDEPLDSYKKPECVKGVMKFFFSGDASAFKGVNQAA